MLIFKNIPPKGWKIIGILIISFFIVLILNIITGTIDIFEIIQYLFALVLSFIVIVVIYNIKNGWKRIEDWAFYYSFEYKVGNTREFVQSQFKKNPNKYFFNARSAVAGIDKKVPYIVGKIEEKQLSFYPYYLIDDSNSTKTYILKGWCMEFKTHRIPVSMIVKRSYLGGKDEINTESANFEKLYHIDVYNGRGTLQLLDPVMIQLIMDSGISAFEFSDKSVVLYYTLYKPNRDQLDNMLKVGLKVAEQVDRNFPLGKYEKK